MRYHYTHSHISNLSDFHVIPSAVQPEGERRQSLPTNFRFVHLSFRRRSFSLRHSGYSRHRVIILKTPLPPYFRLL